MNKKEFLSKWYLYNYKAPAFTTCGEEVWQWIQEYAIEMCKEMKKDCAETYINSFDENETVSSVAHFNIKNTPLPKELSKRISNLLAFI